MTQKQTLEVLNCNGLSQLAAHELLACRVGNLGLMAQWFHAQPIWRTQVGVAQ